METSSGARIDQLSRILANARISIFYLSTYQTDYIFVKEKNIKLVVQTLIANGFQVDCLETFTDSEFNLSNDSYSPDTIEDEVKSIRKQIIPSVPLSLVGLNREFKETWALTLITLMFYSTTETSYRLSFTNCY
jgi:hypothetical protein